MADISPVRDPNYEGFNYSRLLDNAVSPLTNLGQGQLGIAEQNAQRMFELKAQANRAQLESRNRIGEIQAESQAHGQLAAQESERVLNQQAQQKFAQAQQIDPSWKPNPDKTREQNAAAADNVGQQKTLQAYKATTDKLASERKNYYGMLDKLGLPKSIDQTRLGALVAQDPQFVNKLTPAQKDALSSGKVTVDQLVNSLNTGRFLGGLEGLATGVNPRDLASALATTAQTVRQNLQQEQQQLIQLKAGAAGQESLSRQNIYQQQASDLLKAIPPYMIGDAMSYANDKGIDDPGASLLNPDGTVKILNPGGATPTPTGTTVPSTDPNALPPPIDPTPGLNPQLDPSSYREAARAAAAGILADKSQKALSDAQDRLGYLDQLLTKGTVQPPVVPGYAQWAASMASGLTPSGTKLTPEQGELYATEHTKLVKQLPKLHQDAIDAERMKQAFAPKPTPPNPAVVPPGMLWNPNVLQQTPAQPPAPPIAQPTPQGQPQAMNDPMQMRAAQNQVARTFGTSDPAILQAAKNLALQSGMNPQSLQQTIQAASQGDPNAVMTVKSFIAKAQAGNNGQIAAMPQLPSSGYQSFGA